MIRVIVQAPTVQSKPSAFNPTVRPLARPHAGLFLGQAMMICNKIYLDVVPLRRCGSLNSPQTSGGNCPHGALARRVHVCVRWHGTQEGRSCDILIRSLLYLVHTDAGLGVQIKGQFVHGLEHRAMWPCPVSSACLQQSKSRCVCTSRDENTLTSALRAVLLVGFSFSH